MRDYVEQVKELREGAEWAKKLCAHETAKRQSDAADAIEELLAKVPKWVSVEELLPEDGKNVLVLYQNGDMAVAHIHGHDEHINFWRVCTDEGWESDGDAEPSHWMPLPEPPKGD